MNDYFKNMPRHYALFLISFIPVIFKGLEYLAIGVAYPLLVLVILSIPFLLLFFVTKNYKKAIKYWSLLIIGYSIIRVFLIIIALIDSSGIPSGIFYQFTWFYYLKTIGFFMLGWTCLVKRRKISEAYIS